MLETRPSWALALIDTAKKIQGITRLHKYAFLVSKRVGGINNLDFYDDWEPSNYGPFSKELATDVCVLIDKGFITNKTETSKHGYNVGMISITEIGSRMIKEFEERYSKYMEKIEELVKRYQPKRLLDLLHDVYYLYPQYAVNSKIRAEVGRRIFESDSYLNPQYDYFTD